jgi:hypothetical protein
MVGSAVSRTSEAPARPPKPNKTKQEHIAIVRFIFIITPFLTYFCEYKPSSIFGVSNLNLTLV